MSDSFSLRHIQTHPGDFLGPDITSTLAQAVLIGIILNQSAKFWHRYPSETPLVRTVVAFVSIVALAQTAGALYNTWHVYVLHFGDWVTAINMSLPQRLQILVTVLMGAPVQGFLIWRCWILTNKSMLTIIPLISLLLGSIVVSVIVTVQAIKIDFVGPLQPSARPARKVQVDVSYILSMAFPAVLDVSLTSIMMVYLLRARSSVFTSRFRGILHDLITISWEAALPPCACAIATVGVYLAWADRNFWNLFLQAILGDLYVISLLFTLNGRANLQARARLNHLTLPEIYCRSVPQIRIATRDANIDDEPTTPASYISEHPHRVPDIENAAGDSEKRDWATRTS